MEKYELVRLETQDENTINAWKGVRKIGADQPISMVSSKTVLLPHENVLEIVDGMGLEYDTSLANNDAMMFVKIEPSMNITMEGTDEIDLGLEIVNNLKSPRVVVCPYTFRVACTNAMEHNSGNVSHVHRLDTPNRLENTLGEMVGAMDHLKELIENKYTLYQGTIINQAEAIKILDHGTPKKYITELETTVIDNGWDLFNTLTDLNTHDQNRTQIGKRNFNRFLEKSMDTICTQAVATA